MQRLSLSEIERVRLFLEETSVTCDIAGFPSVVLPAVQKLIPSIVVCYAQVDPVRGKLVAQELLPSVAPYKDDGAFERHMFEHPVFEQWGQEGVGSAVRRSDLLSRSEWHRRGLFQEVYRLWGCEDSMPIGLPAPNGLLACICSERDTEFTDRELALIEMVRPHVAQTYRSAEIFSLLGTAVSSNAVGSIVLDGAGRPLLVSEAAWDLIADYVPGNSHPALMFPPPINGWIHGELSRFDRANELPRSAEDLVLAKPNGDQLVLRILLGLKTGEQAVLALEERRVERPPTISPRFGLSPREEEVLVMVRQGHTSTDIAERLFISRRTVEKHLENVFYKLGVETRTAAVTLAFSPNSSN